MEDDESSGRLMRTRLERSGCEVTWARDGQEAVDVVRQACQCDQLAGDFEIVTDMEPSNALAVGSSSRSVGPSSSRPRVVLPASHTAPCPFTADISAGTQGLFDLVLMDSFMPRKNGGPATRELRQLGVQCWIVGVTGDAFTDSTREFLDAGLDDLITKPVDRAQLAAVLDAARYRKRGLVASPAVHPAIIQGLVNGSPSHSAFDTHRQHASGAQIDAASGTNVFVFSTTHRTSLDEVAVFRTQTVMVDRVHDSVALSGGANDG